MTASVHRLHPKVPANPATKYVNPTPSMSEAQESNLKAVRASARLHKETRELEKQIRRKAKEIADIRAELQLVEHWKFGDWYLTFKAREVKSIPHHTPANCIWTWVDGTRFDGDIDVIVPGLIEGIAIKMFVTETPHPPFRIKVACY